jgi:hypothetical protein
VDALETTPGQTTIGTVALRSVTVHVQTKIGIPVALATVKAHHDADNGCAAGNDYTLGVTDVLGNLTAALPYGRWQFTVTAYLPFPGPGWAYFTLDPTLGTPTNVTVVTQ